MLRENRKRFDALMGAAGPSDGGREIEAPAPSASVRLLNERYGAGWRHGIVERRREDGEAVVLCRLEIDELGIVKSQFGRAPIGGGSGAAGTAGGIAFRSATPAGAGAETDEAAFEAALEAALAKCVALI